MLMLAAGEPGEAGFGHSHGQLRAADGLVHPHADQIGLGERVEGFLDLGDDSHLLAVEGRLVGIALLVVRREVPCRQLLAQVEHTVERFAGMLGEPLPLGELVDPQPLVQQKVEVAPREQGGLHSSILADGRRRAAFGPIYLACAASDSPGSAPTSTPSGESARTASSRIRPRSSAVLNSMAISCAVRLPCGRSQR